MKYVVIECHLSYAVVLDEEGRFMKVANRNYEVGQTVTEVIEMEEAASVSGNPGGRFHKWMSAAMAAAACLAVIAVSILQMGQDAYASVYMTINPQIRIDVNRKDVVVDIESLNEDGKILTDGYGYQKKKIHVVLDELADQAVDLGYLREGGSITLSIEASDAQWMESHAASMAGSLKNHVGPGINVIVETSENEGEGTLPVFPAGQENGNGENDVQPESRNAEDILEQLEPEESGTKEE